MDSGTKRIISKSTVAFFGFRDEKGFLWPDHDTRCAEVTFQECDRLKILINKHMHGRYGVAVQAGGNCGQLVRTLADWFHTVYTFEPHPQNFVALTANTADFENVHRYQAALGGTEALLEAPRGMRSGDARYPDTNCGAYYMTGKGSIPTIALDTFHLRACDLLCLDVEGGELRALTGAVQTITLHSPVVIIEEKGLGKKFYGHEHTAGEFLQSRGYGMVERVGNDEVWTR